MLIGFTRFSIGAPGPSCRIVLAGMIRGTRCDSQCRPAESIGRHDQKSWQEGGVA